MVSDPFTTVYDDIENKLRADGYKLVSWNSSRDPEPDIPTDSELPELQLRPSGLVINLGSQSCGSEVVRTFQLLINSGDQRVKQLFGIEWRLFKTFFDLKYETLNKYDWVISVEIAGSQTGLSNSTENRGIKGWTALWTIDVRMQLYGSEF